MLEHSLNSVLICGIHTVRFSLDCSWAAVCPCTVFRVRCQPHSEDCDPITGKSYIYWQSYSTFSNYDHSMEDNPQNLPLGNKVQDKRLCDILKGKLFN